ncbi:hypothetical protein [Robertmurraya siralis]|uniref:hypothetical protein n=1 Tax=Robertmurraya siralis TaxID=77777 RepID=UPI0010F7DA7A|nr:hypothetical protein [Robertmurraya siralis]
MFVVIVKQGNQYELQHKPTIDSRVVSHAERASSDEALKMSLSLDWKPYTHERILWYAECGQTS